MNYILLYFQTKIRGLTKTKLPAKMSNTDLAKRISGTWINQLKSTLEIKCSSDGELSGYYITTVGKAKNKYPLSGRANLSVDDKATLGFTVSWANEHQTTNTTTSWTGIYSKYISIESIETTWVLVSSSKPKWKSVLINQDQFTRKA